MKKYTLENAIESLKFYLSKIDKNGLTIFENDLSECTNSKDIKYLIVEVVMTRFGADVLNYESNNSLIPEIEDLERNKSLECIEGNWSDRLNAIYSLERHSYYSDEAFCEYFQQAFPYIMKNDRTLLDA